jgi:hypothetical protein
MEKHASQMSTCRGDATEALHAGLRVVRAMFEDMIGEQGKTETVVSCLMQDHGLMQQHGGDPTRLTCHADAASVPLGHTTRKTAVRLHACLINT